jgi:hypothetical protein
MLLTGRAFRTSGKALTPLLGIHAYFPAFHVEPLESPKQTEVSRDAAKYPAGELKGSVFPAFFHSPENSPSPVMANVDRAYNHVRQELAQVGLLADGLYLDAVELVVSGDKSEGERGYVFEQVGHYAKWGYRPGVIYLPRDLPHQPRKPGMTLCDTIRHEYAHAWFFHDPSFFRDDWFVRTFGTSYSNCNATPYNTWRRILKRNPEYQAGKKRCRSERGQLRYFYGHLLSEFITDYATTNASEDFAETFMFFLKYRRSLHRFKNRPRVYLKIKSVERAVAAASRRVKTLGTGRYRPRSA